MKAALRLIALLLIATPCSAWAAEGDFIPRKLVALYDSRYELDLRQNTIHRFLGMPANQLGYDIEYHDVNRPLPALDDDTHGILIWFHYEPIPEVGTYIDWLAENLEQGRHLAVLENMGIGRVESLSPEHFRKLQTIYARIGIRDMGGWRELTYNSRIIHRNPDVVDFERKMRPPLPSYAETVATAQGVSHMRISPGENLPGAYADVVVTGPQGGYVAPGYAYHEQDLEERTVSVWLINPFRFLELSLKPPLYPVPDVTTRFGRRIFFSQIDGDGWNNPTHIEKHRDKFASSADVLTKEIFEAYPDFPFTVGVVAGDVADDCFGSEKSRKTARQMLALPNVEVASHTYTHPLYWQFFRDYTEEKERPYAANYPKRSGLFRQDFGALFSSHTHDAKPPVPSMQDMKDGFVIRDRQAAEREEMLAMYKVPRAYNCVPFSEHNEIVTAKEVIESLAPEGKKVTLLQWSGNTSPYEGFLRATREAGLLNINGGESRYDAEYPSYSTLYPIGIKIGGERQIYSSASNENTYTNLWSERFYGYRYLLETLRHTESPIRVSPFNVYFHSYSGERPGSLRALKEIMNYARKQELIPLIASDYVRIAMGFYSTRVERIAPMHWRIYDRQKMQTLRLPAPRAAFVDISQSKGVLGQRILLDNLYIFLNPSVDKPEIILKEMDSEAYPSFMTLYSSRWDILSAERQGATAIRLTTQGYGQGEMTWLVPRDGVYTVTVIPQDGQEASRNVSTEDGRLHFSLEDVSGIHPVEVRLSLKEAV